MKSCPCITCNPNDHPLIAIARYFDTYVHVVVSETISMTDDEIAALAALCREAAHDKG